MVELTAGDPRYRDDRGAADPAVAAALAACAAGTGGEHAALIALASTRLLIPVVVVHAEELREPFQGEKASEMAMPSITGHDGRPALPAFTCVDAIRRWQPAARPVPVAAAGVWQSAVHESFAVVIDIAGPVPLAIEGARLAAMAAGRVPPAMHEDPDVWQQVAAAAAEVTPGIRIRLSAAPDDLDFTLELAPPAGATQPVPGHAASQIAAAATKRLAGRVRLGIGVIVQPPG